jgi:hypothetical protein
MPGYLAFRDLTMSKVATWDQMSSSNTFKCVFGLSSGWYVSDECRSCPGSKVVWFNVLDRPCGEAPKLRFDRDFT